MDLVGCGAKATVSVGFCTDDEVVGRSQVKILTPTSDAASA